MGIKHKSFESIDESWSSIGRLDKIWGFKCHIKDCKFRIVEIN